MELLLTLSHCFKSELSLCIASHEPALTLGIRYGGVIIGVSWGWREVCLLLVPVPDTTAFLLQEGLQVFL